MGLKVIVTLGPSIMDAGPLRRIAALTECIFRINGAHFDDMEAVRHQIRALREALESPQILIDLPGNKIRTAHLSEPITLVAGKTFSIPSYQFNYEGFCRFLRRGQTVTANDSLFRLEVVAADERRVEFLSHSTGVLGNNKGIHLLGATDELPFLFDRDRALIEVGLREKVHAIGLSFVRDSADVSEAKRLLGGRPVKLFAKVEKVAAVKNLAGILEEVETIIIDRGDLSAETGMLQLPYYQNLIIEKAAARGREVILATQFLKNMETKPVPVIPEVIDLFNTFRMGIHGVQLSEESAVGRYPEECLRLVCDMYRVAQRDYVPAAA